MIDPPVTVGDERANVNDPRVTIDGAWTMTEPRWDDVYASADPGGCMPGCVFLKASMFVRWPDYRGDAGCYLHGGTTDSGHPSFHSRGRAIDIWISAGHLDVGTAMFDWCVANRVALGLNEVIFDGRIWRADNPGAGVHAYTVNPHRDHIHIAVNLAGARMELPWYTHQGHIPTPEEIAAFLRWLEEMNMEHGQAVHSVCAAGDRVITLERWGGMQTSWGASFDGAPYWPGLDNARQVILRGPRVDGGPSCITHASVPVSGWVLDLNGGMHPFRERGKSVPMPPARTVGYWAGGKQMPFNEIA